MFDKSFRFSVTSFQENEELGTLFPDINITTTNVIVCSK